MKRSSMYVLVAALAVSFTLALLPTQQPAVAQDDSDKLLRAMAEIGSKFSQVRRQRNKPEMYEDTAKLLSEIIEVSVACKPYMPESATTDDLKLTYKVLMNKMIIAFANAENAALQGDKEKLNQYIKEAQDLRSEGHELFITEE